MKSKIHQLGGSDHLQTVTLFYSVCGKAFIFIYFIYLMVLKSQCMSFVLYTIDLGTPFMLYE